ncbi:hypothetical protein FB451DRAFT_1184758 [Mycena latifolia]|nr:hypothetical protein FB451DRAFT_1184758 [Mycena latifolia]
MGHRTGGGDASTWTQSRDKTELSSPELKEVERGRLKKVAGGAMMQDEERGKILPLSLFLTRCVKLSLSRIREDGLQRLGTATVALAQTLMTGFPERDVMRGWSETNSLASITSNSRPCIFPLRVNPTISGIPNGSKPTGMVAVAWVGIVGTVGLEISQFLNVPQASRSLSPTILNTRSEIARSWSAISTDNTQWRGMEIRALERDRGGCGCSSAGGLKRAARDIDVQWGHTRELGGTGVEHEASARINARFGRRVSPSRGFLTARWAICPRVRRVGHARILGAGIELPGRPSAIVPLEVFAFKTPPGTDLKRSGEARGLAWPGSGLPRQTATATATASAATWRRRKMDVVTAIEELWIIGKSPEWKRNSYKAKVSIPYLRDGRDSIRVQLEVQNVPFLPQF